MRNFGVHFKSLLTMEGEFVDCYIEQMSDKENPFPGNSFVKVTEKGVKYLINTDYIISCVI